MSKIGKIPIKIPEGVKVNKDRDIVRISGPKGELSVSLPVHLEIEINAQEIRIYNKGNGKYWMYYVNGTMGGVGADKKIVKEGDLIEWRLE